MQTHLCQSYWAAKCSAIPCSATLLCATAKVRMGTAIPKLVAWLKLAFAWSQQLRGFTPFTHSEPHGWWKEGITSGMSRQIGCHTPCRPTDYIIFNVIKDGVNGCG